jgi:hypothetical protein
LSFVPGYPVSPKLSVTMGGKVQQLLRSKLGTDGEAIGLEPKES